MDGEANQSCSSSNNEAVLPKSDDFTPEEAAALLILVKLKKKQLQFHPAYRKLERLIFFVQIATPVSLIIDNILSMV